MPGFFISFEGGDGAGKTTQIRRLSTRLQQAGREVVETREPGGSEGAEAIRELLVKGDKEKWSATTEALLVYAARRDHLEKTIIPALQRGAVVLTDRFADSSMAYQGIAGDAGEQFLDSLHEFVVGERQPDLTIILDVAAETGLARADASKGETRFEEKGPQFQNSVRQAFRDIARRAPHRCVLIDAGRPVEEVSAAIESAIREKIPALLS